MKQKTWIVCLFFCSYNVFLFSMDLSFLGLNTTDINFVLPPNSKNLNFSKVTFPNLTLEKLSRAVMAFQGHPEVIPDNFQIGNQIITFQAEGIPFDQRINISFFYLPGDTEKIKAIVDNEFLLRTGFWANSSQPIFEGLSNGEVFGDNILRCDEDAANPSNIVLPPGVKLKDTGEYSVKYHHGDFAVFIECIEYGGCDLSNFSDGLTRTFFKKRSLNLTYENLESNILNLITQPGILKSLKVKLEVFKKNYLNGEYKAALNNINAFVNELNAQKGKHVSESTFQILNDLANLIINSL